MIEGYTAAVLWDQDLADANGDNHDGNNCLASGQVTVQPPPIPVLIVLSIVTNPVTPAPGQNVDVAESNEGNNVFGPKTISVAVVDTTPPIGSISINEGKVWTKTTSVTLYLSCDDGPGGSGCAEMQVSNDRVFDTEPWEPFALTKAWTLPTGDGTKKVYVRYRDGAGNISASFFDTIKLDTTRPVVSNVSDTPDPFSPSLGQVSTISFTVSDNMAGKCRILVKIFNPAGILVRTIKKIGVSCPAVGAASSVTWDGKDGVGSIVPSGTYTYKIWAIDKAGNRSAVRKGTSTVQ